jgi:hypothetical protein
MRLLNLMPGWYSEIKCKREQMPVVDQPKKFSRIPDDAAQMVNDTPIC